MSIKKVDDYFALYQVENTQDYQFWIVIKFLPGCLYELKEGDTLKFGRALLKVKKICSKIERTVEIQEILDTPGEKLCKICCSDEVTKDDPLISPCSCAGSMKYVHFLCLKNWLKGKVTTRSVGNVSSYQWADFKCEVCNSPIPEVVQFKQKLFSLIEIVYPTSPYIILDEIKPDSPGNQILYVVGLNEKESVSIGRANDAQIKLSDISVSRLHAKLKLLNNTFFVQDNTSKFGTLVSVFKHLLLSIGHDLTIQVNRTVVNFVVKRPWTCCKKSKVLPTTLNQ